MKFNKLIGTCLACMALLCFTADAETFHLSGQGWQSVTDSPEGQYLLAMSKIKQQLLTGTGKEVIQALEDIKENHPDLAGPEIDDYIKAEKLYSKSNWYKAATEYTKFVETWPDSILQPSAMERIYGIATAFLQGEKRTFLWVLKLPAFDDGVDLMNTIADKAGNAPIALRALTTLAENQEKRKLMLDAYHTWAEIADRWPTGQTGRNALLRMAQTLHAAYRGTQYDSSVLESAQTYYEDFVSRYASQAKDLEISQTLNLIKEQLAYKDYSMGYFYERTSKSDAALMYYNQTLTEWPDTKAAQMAQARLDPDAVPAVKPTLRRKAVNLTESFLDSWFGVQKVADAMLPDEPREKSNKIEDEYIEIDPREPM